MFREFVLPTTATATSLFSLLVNNGYCDSLGNMLVASAKNGAIIPDRVAELDLRPGDDVTGTVFYQDNSGSASVASVLSNMSKRSNRNSICLKDYLIYNLTVAGTEVVILEIESV